VDEHKRTLVAAQGYCELGMHDDALAELDTLPPEAQALPTVLEMRLVILMQARRWKEALEPSVALCRLQPESTSGFVHAAFCLHELGRTAEAKEMLLSGPATLRDEATFYYNLACYECALGNLDIARQLLDRSFSMDSKFREYAKTDSDLEPLRRA
jgi:predicted Zn-dependent protease